MYPEKPTRAVCIMFRDDEVLLMHRVKGGEEYWTFPGGGVEDDETIEEAVVREVLEETTMPIQLEKLLYIHNYETSDQYYYLCKYISGEPVLGDSVEKERMEKVTSDIYGPEWVPLDNVEYLLLYPLEIRDWLLEDFQKGFDFDVRQISLKVADLRQSLED